MTGFISKLLRLFRRPKPISPQQRYVTTIWEMNEYGEEFIRREWR